MKSESTLYGQKSIIHTESLTADCWLYVLISPTQCTRVVTLDVPIKDFLNCLHYFEVRIGFDVSDDENEIQKCFNTMPRGAHLIRHITSVVLIGSLKLREPVTPLHLHTLLQYRGMPSFPLRAAPVRKWYIRPVHKKWECQEWVRWWSLSFLYSHCANNMDSENTLVSRQHGLSPASPNSSACKLLCSI